jgi:DNA/RNA-binding domain of Phe-tRNA-synthetase-like protein
MADPELQRGWIEGELGLEFPELALWLTRLHARSGASPAVVRTRLRELAGRINGNHVVHMRQDAVPWAYRVFWRQVGIDPDSDRTPVERLAVERLRAGGLPSRNLLDDAVTIATLETGVPVLALDGDRVGARVGLRLTGAGECLGGSGSPLSERTIAVADEHRTLALLSGELAGERGVTRRTSRIVLGAIQVKGVPLISVEEALWTVADTLSASG